jgi:hypothetical protein
MSEWWAWKRLTRAELRAIVAGLERAREQERHMRRASIFEGDDPRYYLTGRWQRERMLLAVRRAQAEHKLSVPAACRFVVLLDERFPPALALRKARSGDACMRDPDIRRSVWALERRLARNSRPF